MLRKPGPGSHGGYQPLPDNPDRPEQPDKQPSAHTEGPPNSSTAHINPSARPPPPPPAPGLQPVNALARRNSTGAGLLRKISPGPDQARRHLAERPLERNAKEKQPTVTRTVAPGQPAPPKREIRKEKFVSLPEVLDDDIEAQLSIPLHSKSIFEDLESSSPLPTTRGRIAIYCTAEGLDREALQTALQAKGPHWLLHKYPDCLYGKWVEEGEPDGDIFYFDYGCVAFWGLKAKQEQEVLKALIKPVQHGTLEHRELEVDEFQFHYTASERPHIQNDTITINHRFAGDHLIKLSISHALSQSTKLCVFEERVLEIVQGTRDLPERLASSGKVDLSRKEIARLIGKVFLQKAAVNLLSTVLDTPEFFWSAPDSMQTLYKKVCEDMELEERVEVLNNRFQVLQEMLDMLRDHRNTEHSAHLEWIVIWLIVVEVIVGLFECASILGWVGHE